MLLLINGPPGVGKSTLAQRYADDHALALVVDVDAIRMQLGQWAAVDESKLVARDLARALIRAHLQTGHDVVVAQYLGRPEFREKLRGEAEQNGARFVEVVVGDAVERVAARFRQRRAELASAGIEHPEGDLADADVTGEVKRASEALVADASVRGVPVVSADGGPDAAYQALLRVLGSRS